MELYSVIDDSVKNDQKPADDTLSSFQCLRSQSAVELVILI